MTRLPTSSTCILHLHMYLDIHPRHHLKIYGILGEGCFGQVWKCEALNIDGVKVSLNLTETCESWSKTLVLNVSFIRAPAQLL